MTQHDIVTDKLLLSGIIHTFEKATIEKKDQPSAIDTLCSNHRLNKLKLFLLYCSD